MSAADPVWLARFARWREAAGSPLAEVSEPDSEDLIRHAEHLLAQGRCDEALAAAHRGRVAARRFPIPGTVVFLLSRLTPQDGWRSLSQAPAALAELLPCLGAVFGAQAHAVLAPDAGCLDVLRQVLVPFGGNRSACPVLRDPDGRLVPYQGPIPARAQGGPSRCCCGHGRWTRCWVVLGGLRREHPNSSVVRTYHGELLLWTGRYTAAAEAFHDALALDRETRWAWIGLGATRALTGEAAQALETWATGEALTGPGPTLFAYRGELLRRQGELGVARTELDQAQATSPRRLATRINVALLEAAEGDGAGARELATAVLQQAPGFLEQAAAADKASPEALLEALLNAMRGNRSSAMPCWFDAQDRLHFLTPWVMGRVSGRRPDLVADPRGLDQAALVHGHQVVLVVQEQADVAFVGGGVVCCADGDQVLLAVVAALGEVLEVVEVEEEVARATWEDAAVGAAGEDGSASIPDVAPGAVTATCGTRGQGTKQPLGVGARCVVRRS